MTVKGREGLQAAYPVYTCHRPKDTNMMILPQTVLAEFGDVVMKRDDELAIYRAVYEQDTMDLKLRRKTNGMPLYGEQSRALWSDDAALRHSGSRKKRGKKLGKRLRR